jgi:hypothetical protein
MPADQEKGDRDVGADAVLGCFLRLADILVNGPISKYARHGIITI